MTAFAALLLAWPLAAASSETPKTAPTGASAAKPVAALERIAVIGASLSAGFRLDGNLKAFATSKIQLADVVQASLRVPHERIANHATQAFFMDAKGIGSGTLASLAEEKPSLVVALDYLFWFGYGSKKEEERVPDVEQALAGLAEVGGTILLGDLPDMTAASQTPDPVFGHPMLKPEMLPKPETLTAINAKIRAFAEQHPNVVIVPLADLTVKLGSDAEFAVRGNKYPKGSLDKLMQADRLHPTLEGTCAVWVAAIDTWLARAKELPAGAFELDIAKLLPAIEAARPKAAPAGAPAEKPGPQPGKTPAPTK